ncbi:DNA-binding transcriptional MocR family regulator [Erwinia persicina]|jgi:DNA-binding transcriptional MocR family regulator|uniref:PLP-dependent aminotransferase family protein n=2 Tax=Erwinia TaxID=551 RepID=A0ABV4E211_9GAMM|nr:MULTISPECIES: PLP-dependent aminotransferase family protein [Erwinia]MCP1440735.1 DNA-binding transcriptional MocR family regulator [Erwinia persicina]MDN4627825.1 PLP-dependent aminotransferase family protein [Erwinia sp. PsM31]MDN8539940.1 PLP-dependent aminotransferase family protein [Erwinia sp. BC051422]
MLSKKSAGIKSSAVRELLKFSKIPGVISLAGGIPATDLIDVEGIDTVLKDILSREHRGLFQYSVTEGEEHLREQLSRWNSGHNLNVDAESIIITNGSQQAIDLLSRVFLEKGDKVFVERPTYLAALQIFGYTDATVVELEYDSEGIELNLLEKEMAAGGVKMVYLTPNFANPTGNTISYEQRVKIAKLSQQYQVVIIEDDPYGHLRFSGDPVPSIFSVAQSLFGKNHNVCYMSSFSKIFSPGLRLGWLAVPEHFHMATVVAKQALDLHTSTLNQSIAAHYIESGRINERVEILKATYKDRRDYLIGSLHEYSGGDITWNTPDGGMFLWCHLAEGIDASQLLQECIKENVVFVPGEVFFARDPQKNSLRLSYSMLTAETAREAVIRISRALKKIK